MDSHGDHRVVSTGVLDELSSVVSDAFLGTPGRGHVFLTSPAAELSSGYAAPHSSARLLRGAAVTSRAAPLLPTAETLKEPGYLVTLP